MAANPITCRLRVMTLGVGLLASLLGLAAFAQELPDELSPGFRPNQAFQVSNIDAIQPYSGEVAISPPLGPTYDLASGYRWRLELVSTAKPWKMDGSCSAQGVSVQHAAVAGLPSAGFGFTLHAGFIGFPQANGFEAYVSPSGATHRFTPIVGDGLGRLETTDGSQLRLTKIGNPATDYLMEWPDGMRMNFASRAHWPAAPSPYRDFQFRPWLANGDTNTYYFLSSISNSFGTTVLRVDHVAPFGSADDWKIDRITLSPDAPLYSRVINFRWKTHTVAVPDGYGAAPTWPVLDWIDFPTAENRRLRATSQFLQPAAGSYAVFRRNEYDTSAGSACPNPTIVAAPLLTAIQFSDSTPAPATFAPFSYQFVRSIPATLAAPIITDGLITDVILPTGGRISYTYDSTVPNWCFGSGCTTAEDSLLPTAPAMVEERAAFAPNDPIDRFQKFLDESAAVVNRTEYDPQGGAPPSTTTYSRYQYILQNGLLGADTTNVVRTTLVGRPNGNGTGSNWIKHFFHVGIAAGDTAAGLEIERRTYSAEQATPIRTTVHCWESDSFNFPPPSPICGYKSPSTGQVLPYNLNASARQQKQITWFGTNPLGGGDCSQSAVHCKQTENFDYNASAREYGRMRTTVNNVTLAQSGWLAREERTAWTRSPTSPDPWLLKLYSSKATQEFYVGACPNPPCLVTSEYSFDQNNGFLNWTRSSDPPTIPASGSILTTTFQNANDGFGSVASETVSGVGSVTDSFTTNWTHANGHVLSSRWNPDPGWFKARVDRERNANLVTASYDANSLATLYGYDAFDRLRSITPPDVMPTRYCYSMTSATGLPSYVIARQSYFDDCTTTSAGSPTEGSGTLQAWEFDGFGRVIREIFRLPNGVGTGGSNTLSYRRTKYNEAGYRYFVSELVPCNTNDIVACFGSDTAVGTTYSNFDGFGRPRTITKADNTVTSLYYDDFWGGPSNSDSTVVTVQRNRGTSSSCATKAIRKDIFDNILIATAAHNSCDPASAILAQRALYTYNVLDQLASVSYFPTGQTRTFGYDPFGLLRSEVHPELPAVSGPQPFATTTYPLYNALRKPRSKELRDGSLTLYNGQSFNYDTANRLLQVWASDGTGSKLFVENTYDTVTFPCAAGSKSKGRLSTQTSYHPGDAAETYSDTFCYEDGAGRLTKKHSSLGSDQIWTYNNRGLVETHIHPRVDAAIKDPFLKTTFSTNTYYTSGYPTRVTANYTLNLNPNSLTVVSSATYNPAGGLLSYTAGNGMLVKITQDPNFLARPSRIQATFGRTTFFDSGPHGYDGESNITSIGEDTFTYDARSRLIGSHILNDGNVHDESFTLDDYNNMTQRSMNDNGQPTPPILLPTNPMTNRLLPDAANQIVAEYNRTGDLTKYGTPAIGVQEHFYDALSRQLELRVNGVTERYRYDAAGERLIRKIPTEVANPQVYGSRFYTLQPACRLVDTRTTYGPILQGQVERTFVAFGNCGIPSNASSLAANVAAVDPTANGFLRIYPPGISERPQTEATATRAGLTRATQSMVGLSSQGKFSLFPDLPAGATSHLVVDLAGYFVKNPPPPPGPTRRETHFVTLRDEKNRLLTDYRAEYDIDIASGVGTLRRDGHPYVEKDYVYLGGQLVATFSQINGWRFLVNDHLGSPRRVLDGLRNVVGMYKYRPFGTPLNLTSPTQGNDFCGMEKDAMSGDHYDHARYLTSWTGRFGGVDRVSGSATDPQSWNRYKYARANPLRYVDRDGNAEKEAFQIYASQSEAYDHLSPTTPGERTIATGIVAGFSVLAAPAALEFAAGSVLRFAVSFPRTTAILTTIGAASACACNVVVSTEASIASGLLKPGGGTAQILANVEKQFIESQPTNIIQAYSALAKGAAQAGFGPGQPIERTAERWVIQHGGNITTTIFKTGETIVKRGEEVILHIAPKAP